MPLRRRARHVVLRVLHLLGGAVLQLEADVVEQQQRDEREEDAPVGLRSPAGKPATPCSNA